MEDKLRMNRKEIITIIDHVSHYSLLGIFLFSSVAFLFMFVINWEDWFFGMKMDGLPAGILLFTKFLITASLAYLLIRYPDKIAGITALSFLFYGFLFLDSAITVQKLTGGQEFISIISALLVMVPAGILIVRILARKTGKTNDDAMAGKSVNDPAFMMAEREKPDRYATGNTLMLVFVVIVAAFLIGSVVLSIFFSCLHSPVSTAVPVGNSLLSKVSANGTTEWQTLITGYSDFPLQVSSSPDGGFIIGGMLWLSGNTDASLRVMKFDRNGNPVWDIQRGVSAYPETNLGALQAVLPAAGEYTVVMIDGFVIRLDAEGNELWHHDYSDTIVHTSISRSDGGYLLIGDAHEGSPSEPGWKKFDGWILSADRKGGTVWEKKEPGFSNCMRALQSPEGNLLVSCFVSGSDPDQAGNQIVALDLQGNYLWKKNFVEKKDGIIYSIKPLDDGNYEVYLRGEGERKYTLDHLGNTLEEEVLPSKPDSFSHEIVPDTAYEAESLAGNRTQVKVIEAFGAESIFIMGYPMNREDLSGIYSVNPTSDGGYLVASSAKR